MGTDILYREYKGWHDRDPTARKRNGFGFEDPLKKQGDWRELWVYPQKTMMGEEYRCSDHHVPILCAILRDFGLIDQTPFTSPDASKVMCPVQIYNVRFSVIGPHAHLRAHCGPSNKKLSLHVPLELPDKVLRDGRKVHASRIRVANQTLPFVYGQPIIFDDSFEHEVWNDGNTTRTTLWIFFEKPEIGTCKRKTS